MDVWNAYRRHHAANVQLLSNGAARMQRHGKARQQPFPKSRRHPRILKVRGATSLTASAEGTKYLPPSPAEFRPPAVRHIFLPRLGSLVRLLQHGPFPETLLREKTPAPASWLMLYNTGHPPFSAPLLFSFCFPFRSSQLLCGCRLLSFLAPFPLLSYLKTLCLLLLHFTSTCDLFQRHRSLVSQRTPPISLCKS